jgi:hypothetical protein
MCVWFRTRKGSRRVVDPAGGSSVKTHTHATWALWREKDLRDINWNN